MREGVKGSYFHGMVASDLGMLVPLFASCCRMRRVLFLVLSMSLDPVMGDASTWCNSFWLSSYSPAPYKTYETCSSEKWKNADFTIPGNDGLSCSRTNVYCIS